MAIPRVRSAAATQEELTLALLCPFFGRLACAASGGIASHVKKSGICVYRQWEADFRTYLEILLERLDIVQANSLICDHTVLFGDSRTVTLPSRRFPAMITSPPYPNARYFTSMFAPEHACLSWLAAEQLTSIKPWPQHGIGSTFVSHRKARSVRSPVARRFLSAVENYRGKAQTEYNNRVYYLPYFVNYFADLEEAYGNIAKFFRRSFRGYVIVVNNTASDQVIPLAETVIEIWRTLGFKAGVYDREERFHVGTKNPRARGLKAKHSKFVIEVSRK